MAGKDKQAPKSEEDGAEAQGEQEAQPKQGFVKKLLGNKKLLIIAGAALLLILGGGGAGLYFFVFAAKSGDAKAAAEAQAPQPITPPQVAFFDLPDLTGNIQTADGTPVYLKLSLSLELDTGDEATGMNALKPRINDQIMGYLHELRVDDIKGSAGIMRLKEELLRRVNVAAAPYRVRDVLIREMIFQ